MPARFNPRPCSVMLDSVSMADSGSELRENETFGLLLEGQGEANVGRGPSRRRGVTLLTL